MVGLDDALVQLQLEGEKQQSEVPVKRNKKERPSAYAKRKLVKDAGSLSILLEGHQEGDGSKHDIQVQDGKDLFNLVMGRDQDNDFKDGGHRPK